MVVVAVCYEPLSVPFSLFIRERSSGKKTRGYIPGFTEYSSCNPLIIYFRGAEGFGLLSP
jgi:hypothetical protein